MRDLPKEFSQFSDARKQGFLKVKKVKEDGGMVAGIFCTFTPLEILDAAGFTAVSLCGMSGETIDAAEAHLPKNLCPLIKSSYGFAVSDKCPYTYFSDLIVAESTCDGKKKMYELLNRIRPTYVLHLPQGIDENAREDWTRELHRFINFIEKNYNVKITDDSLRQAARIRNEERRSRIALMQLQKLCPPLAKGLDLYKTLEGAGFLFESEQRINKLNDLRKTLEDSYKEGYTPVKETDKRILITGCPIGGVLDKTVKIIEDNEGVVTCFENCSGIKAAYQMVDAEADDIVSAIADRYLGIGCSVMTPNNIRMELLEELVEEYKIDGVVEIDLQCCTTYNVESFSVKNKMKELNIPYIQIETDYSESDFGQLSTRLEAFLETI